jgi:hypothetical protein
VPRDKENNNTEVINKESIDGKAKLATELRTSDQQGDGDLPCCVRRLRAPTCSGTTEPPPYPPFVHRSLMSFSSPRVITCSPELPSTAHFHHLPSTHNSVENSNESSLQLLNPSLMLPQSVPGSLPSSSTNITEKMGTNEKTIQATTKRVRRLQDKPLIRNCDAGTTSSAIQLYNGMAPSEVSSTACMDKNDQIHHKTPAKFKQGILALVAASRQNKNYPMITSINDMRRNIPKPPPSLGSPSSDEMSKQRHHVSRSQSLTQTQHRNDEWCSADIQQQLARCDQSHLPTATINCGGNKPQINDCNVIPMRRRTRRAQ